MNSSTKTPISTLHDPFCDNETQFDGFMDMYDEFSIDSIYDTFIVFFVFAHQQMK